MFENSINVFASEEYLLLQWLSAHCTKMKGTDVVKFSQKEIADECSCSPTTINKRMQILVDVKCIEPHQKRGIYIITSKGIEVLKQMKEIERIIGGNKK